MTLSKQVDDIAVRTLGQDVVDALKSARLFHLYKTSQTIALAMFMHPVLRFAENAAQWDERQRDEYVIRTVLVALSNGGFFANDADAIEVPGYPILDLMELP